MCSIILTAFRSREVTLPISYTYQVSTATGSEFMTQQAEFCHTHTEDYNWNYLDQHICGYPDFEELGEVTKEKIIIVLVINFIRLI